MVDGGGNGLGVRLVEGGGFGATGLEGEESVNHAALFGLGLGGFRKRLRRNGRADGVRLRPGGVGQALRGLGDGGRGGLHRGSSGGASLGGFFLLLIDHLFEVFTALLEVFAALLERLDLILYGFVLGVGGFLILGLGLGGGFGVRLCSLEAEGLLEAPGRLGEGFLRFNQFLSFRLGFSFLPGVPA